MQFHFLTDMATPSKEPLPRGLDIYKFGRPFLGHQSCIPTLSILCLGEEKIFKEIECSLYKLYGHAPAQEPLPWGS